MTYRTVGQQSPQPRKRSPSNPQPQTESKPTMQPPSPPQERIPPITHSFDFSAPVPTASRRVDLDGMVLSDLDYTTTDPNLDLDLHLDPVEEMSDEMDMLDGPDSPNTAAFAPFIKEIFGPRWRCPSPVILHIGNPSTSSMTPLVCPTWRKSNELFGKVFSYRPGTTSTLNPRLDSMEAGYLFLGIKDGWSSFDEWKQSPALKILKSVDEFLFVNLPRMERLAVAYKSFKLLKVSSCRILHCRRDVGGCSADDDQYYLHATKSDLERVPKWLRPR
jgi:hypothetical protein